ncbi:hypothetical protein LIER_04676 [Lithospermum erythrorhizon]|uniref:Uncharacterized protein n=1 Tax=Lithospermum erythrorhizon TaxID=34254 RepID=A0AAV3NXV0_LITER
MKRLLIIISLTFWFIILFKASAETSNEDISSTPLPYGNYPIDKATKRPIAKDTKTISTCKDCQQMYINKKVQEVIHEKGARGGGETMSRQPQKSQAIGRLNILKDATENIIISFGLLAYHMLL